jgi:hypothetical protein
MLLMNHITRVAIEEGFSYAEKGVVNIGTVAAIVFAQSCLF